MLAKIWHMLWGFHSSGLLSCAGWQFVMNYQPALCNIATDYRPQTALWQKPTITHRIHTFLHIEFKKFKMFFPPRSKYFLWQPILKHPQPMFFSRCYGQSFQPIWNNRQICNSVYFNLLYLQIPTVRQKVLNWMAATFTKFNLQLISSKRQFLFICVTA
jgi:hypothetical protein